MPYMFLANASINPFLLPSENALASFGTTILFVTDVTVKEYANKIVVPPSDFKYQFANKSRPRRDPEAYINLSQATRPPKIPTESIENET